MNNILKTKKKKRKVDKHTKNQNNHKILKTLTILKFLIK